jgi:lipoic acid synthetase
LPRSTERKPHIRKPTWLKRRLPSGPIYGTVCRGIEAQGLHTVCQEAKCPNQWECFSRQTATFLILGSRCTRNCGFCAVAPGPSGPPDPEEPRRVALLARDMALTYVVVTSVTRDDLFDGGAGHFAATIAALRETIPGVRVEVLIPDFQGQPTALATVVAAGPDVLNHNLETVPELYARVRPEADYRRSLNLLRTVRDLAPHMVTKSGLMLGLGETEDQVRRTLTHLREADCLMVTLGQYLQPTPDHLPVRRYVPPEEFDRWRAEALQMGFQEAASGPLVRSSYQARELFKAAQTFS